MSILAVNEFDSDRKMMSILLRIMDGNGQGKILLLCKGADSSVLPLTAGSGSRPNPYRSYCERHIDMYACQGLRTLVFASRYADSTHCISPHSYIHTYVHTCCTDNHTYVNTCIT